MSLDVYLSRKLYLSYDKGATYTEKEETVFSSNITHNLNAMADKAGIYEACWRPEEIECKLAKDIIPILEKGVKELKEKPEVYKKFDSPNGWGTYEHFVHWVEKYLEACKTYPDAEISVSR